MLPKESLNSHNNSIPKQYTYREGQKVVASFVRAPVRGGTKVSVGAIFRKWRQASAEVRKSATFTNMTSK